MCSVRAWRRKCLIQLQWLKSTLFRPNNLPRLLKTNCLSLYTKTLLLLLGIFFSFYDTTHFSSTMFVVLFCSFLSIVLQPHLFSLRNAPFTFPLKQTLWCFSYSIHTPHSVPQLQFVTHSPTALVWLSVSTVFMRLSSYFLCFWDKGFGSL